MAAHPSSSGLRPFVRATTSLTLGASTGATLAAQLSEEMAQCWHAGARPLAETFLARHPELRDQPSAAIQVICEEICLRQEYGVPLDAAEVLARFPQWRAQLEVMLECQRLLQTAPAPVFPEVGDLLGDFQLLSQLGAGGQGRVYLATQPALADRPLVLKVTASEGLEHLTLARLQHTHIVPLYWVQDLPDRNLRVLCMPYFGGASLAQLLEDLASQPVAQRDGATLLRALDRLHARVPIPCPGQGPARQFLRQASYVDALTWLGMCLAEALHYAHQRGLIHLDLKPANVLLAADGQPLLLDFHLSRPPLRVGDPVPDWFGGTPGYLSPEQRAALTAISAGEPVPCAVESRSDLYSLGLVLHEALTACPPPADASPLPRLERANPTASAGLADILARCLETDPAKRYPDAGALAADLRRHLTQRPLEGVPNRSWRERWRKWRRRRPQALTLIGLLLIVAAGFLGAGAVVVRHYRDRLRAGAEALTEGQELLQQQDFTGAARTLDRGREQVEALPWTTELVEALARQQRRAQVGQLTQGLHALADQIRFHYAGATLAPARLRLLEAAARDVWDSREQLWPRHTAQAVAPRVRTDLLDIAVLWTDLRVRLAGAGADVRHAALCTLDEAEQLLGPSPILERERQGHAQALGWQRPPVTLVPRTAWEHYALGRALLDGGDLENAARHFDQAVQREPQGFWSNFYQGVGAVRQERYQEAVVAFRVCIALAPAKPEAYGNRAQAYLGQGQLELALDDCNQALRLQPSFAAAWLTRGVLHGRAKRWPEALADLHQALAQGCDPAEVHYNLALVHEARQDRAQARKHVEQALRQRPAYPAALQLQRQLGGR